MKNFRKVLYADTIIKPPDAEIYFPEIAKYVRDECKLKDISYNVNLNKTKKLSDKGFEQSDTCFDLMSYFNDNRKIDYEDEEGEDDQEDE